MRTIAEDDFLRLLAEKGIGLHPKYPKSRALDFAAGSESRFWQVPPEPERRPYFLATLIDLMGDWENCYVWRHLGAWPTPEPSDHDRINDAVERQILRGVRIPLGTNAIVGFDEDERDGLITLLFSTTVFGWSQPDDLQVVPNHGRSILHTDHHGVVHVTFPLGGELQAWVTKMAEEGFDLPEELPDSTFKRPSWMRKNP